MIKRIIKIFNNSIDIILKLYKNIKIKKNNIINNVLTNINVHISNVYNNNGYIIFLCLLLGALFLLNITIFIKIILIIYLITLFNYKVTYQIYRTDFILTLKVIRLSCLIISTLVFIMLFTIFDMLPSMVILKLCIMVIFLLGIYTSYSSHFIKNVHIEYMVNNIYGMDTFFNVFYKKRYILFANGIGCLFFFILFLMNLSIHIKLFLIINIITSYLLFQDILLYMDQSESSVNIRYNYAFLYASRRGYCDAPNDLFRNVVKNYIPKRRGPLGLTLAVLGCSTVALGITFIHDHLTKTIAIRRTTGVAMQHLELSRQFMNELIVAKDNDSRAYLKQAAKDEYLMYRQNMEIVRDINRSTGLSDGVAVRVF